MPQSIYLPQMWRKRGDAAEERHDPSRQVFWRRVMRVAAIAAAVVAFCGYLEHFTQVFDYLEQKTYGLRSEVSIRSANPHSPRVQEQIVLVTLSDASLESDTLGHSPDLFLPRADQAKVIRELTRDGAKVIAFDLLFDTSQPNDTVLADAIRGSGRVLLACGDKGLERPDILPPEALLLKAGARRGHTRIPLDPERPALDRIEPVISDRGQPVPAFSVEAARMALGLTRRPLQRKGTGWQVPGLPIPLDADGTCKIRYLDRSSDKPFSTFGYEQILNAAASQTSFFQGVFQDKIVLIGDTTRIHGDNHLTPLGMMSGVEIQANAIAMLLARRFTPDASVFVEIVQIVVVAGIAALLASVWRLRRAALFLVLLLPAYFLFNVWWFVERGVNLQLVAPSATIILTALGVLLERGLTEEQEKTRMRGLLQRYVSPKFAGYILQHPELLGRAGRRVTGTILFCDIRGFTALSEQLPPEELVARLNEYFQVMTDIVFRHDGTAASIVGDAMLALFGVPVSYPDHARRAVAAAIEMQDALKELQGTWQTGGQMPFEIGIGINTGEMVVGDVGGQQLTSFTVYGLQVNIASRVESLNKELGSRILITRATYLPVAEEVEVLDPRFVFIKGVENAVEVFEVLGWQSNPPATAPPTRTKAG